MTDRAGFKIDSGHRVTASDLEAVHSAAHEEGFEQGRKEGFQKGLEQGKQEAQKQMEIELAKIAQLFHGIQQPYHDLKDELLAELKKLTLRISEAFLEHQLEEDDLLQHLVEQAVDRLLPCEYELVIHSNPEHQMILEKAIEQQVHPQGFRVQINPKLSVGNILVEAGHSQVDIDLKKTIQEYLSKLEKPLHHHSQDQQSE